MLIHLLKVWPKGKCKLQRKRRKKEEEKKKGEGLLLFGCSLPLDAGGAREKIKCG